MNNQLAGFRADGGEISLGRIKEIADNPYGDEEKQNLAKRLLAAEVELQEHRKVNADLTMWVKRLGYSLKRAKPDSKSPGDAMAYLSAKGLISVEDVLR